MVKRSRRAAVIAASFALGLSCVGPAAHAGLLDGGGSGASVEGVPLPVGGDLLGGDLLGGLLEGDLLGSLLGGGLPLGNVLGGDLLGGGLPLGNVLGGDLLGGGLPLGGLPLGGDGGLLAAEGVVGLVPDLSIVPGLGSVSEMLGAFSDSGSIVPGLQVLDELGVLGILGSM